MKIEIELTPDEFKELFLPSDKQAEFAAKMGHAYLDAMSKVATGTFNNTVGKVFNKNVDKDQG